MRRLPTLVLSHSVTPVLISDSNKEENLSFTPTRNFNVQSSSFPSKKSLRGLEVQAASDDRLLMTQKVLPTIMYTQPIVFADDGSLASKSSQTSSTTQTDTTSDTQKDQTSSPKFIGAQTPVTTAVNPSSDSIYSDQSTAGSSTSDTQSTDTSSQDTTSTPAAITTTTRSYSPTTGASSSPITQTTSTPASTTPSSSTQAGSTPSSSNTSGTSSTPNTSSSSTETSSTPTSTSTSTGTSSTPTTSSSGTSSQTYSNPAASSSSTQSTSTTSGSTGSTSTQPASSTSTSGTSSSSTSGTGTSTSQDTSSGTTQTSSGTTQTSSGTSQTSSGTTSSSTDNTQTSTGTTTTGTTGTTGTSGTTTTSTGTTSTSTGSPQQVASSSGDQQDAKEEAEFVLDDGFDPVTGDYVEIDPNALLGPYEMTAEEEAASQGWGEVIFVNLLVFGSLGFLIWFMYLTYKRRLQEMIDERAINPEAEFIKAKELNVEEKLHLQSWGFNTGGENKVKNVKVTNLTTPLGSYFDLNFDTRFGETQTIIANRALDQYQENCYFELEIMDLLESEVVIGLSSEDAHKKTDLPGRDLDYPNQSIGLGSKGDVTRNGVVLNRYKFEAKYGETIGIGYNFAESRVYLFHNGKYLNDIPRSPSPTKTLKELEKTNPPKDSKSLNTKGEPVSRLNSDKNYQSGGTPKDSTPKDSKAGTPRNMASSKTGKKVNAGAPDTPTNTLKTGEEDKPLVHVIELMKGQKYFPVIGTTGPCKVILNIGGAPFRIHHKSIAQGLL